MTPEILKKLVLVLVPLILSLAVHEFAHAAMVRALGDDTATRRGRFTLNPLSHIDPLGSLLLPTLLVISGSGFWFGWAKPVPFDPSRFRPGIRPKTGVLLTAAAGPISNLVLAALAAALIGVFPGHGAVGALLHATLILNVTLFLFNLLPIPPLDGASVIIGLMPDRADRLVAFFRARRWIALVAFVLVFFFAGNLIGRPIMGLSRLLLRVFS